MSGTGRILGLDYGTKTVGVAVSDPLFLTAQGVEIIRREKPTKLRRTLARIEELIAEYGVTSIVLGYPMHLNGDEGDRCEATKAFKEMLEKRTKLPVTLVDERLTTVEAHRTMNDLNIKNKKKKDVVDTIAAVYILEQYMNSKK